LSNPKPKVKPDDVTGNSPHSARVLDFVRDQKQAEKERGSHGGSNHGGTHGGGGHAGGGGGDDHDEQVHVDERWLIAYADKMTLLAGLFIMLFSMSTLDKVKFQKVKESTEKSFGKPVDKKDTTQMVDLQDYNKRIEQLEESKKALEKAQESETVLKAKLEQIQKQLDERTQDKTQIVTFQKQITVISQTVEEQRQKIQELQKENEILEKKIPRTDPQNRIQELQKIVTQQEKKIEQLQTELVDAKETAATGSFLAFVMSWSTRSHDIDLKVEDPQGRFFDFKKRQHKDHPGLFVLDTRQGPGAEIWQAENILVGTYTFHFHFYNQHGNSEPCPITARLFSPKGGVEIPTFQLDGANKRNHKIRIALDKNGKATLLP
jgi:hypothetical protein